MHFSPQFQYHTFCLHNFAATTIRWPTISSFTFQKLHLPRFLFFFIFYFWIFIFMACLASTCFCAANMKAFFLRDGCSVTLLPSFAMFVILQFLSVLTMYKFIFPIFHLLLELFSFVCHLSILITM